MLYKKSDSVGPVKVLNEELKAGDRLLVQGTVHTILKITKESGTQLVEYISDGEKHIMMLSSLQKEINSDPEFKKLT